MTTQAPNRPTIAPPVATLPKPSWLSALSLALIMVIASHAVPDWLYSFLPDRFLNRLWKSGLANEFYDSLMLAFCLILCLPTPLRCGIRIGHIRAHWWKTLLVMAVPIALTANVTCPLRKFVWFTGCITISGFKTDVTITAALGRLGAAPSNCTAVKLCGPSPRLNVTLKAPPASTVVFASALAPS